MTEQQEKLNAEDCPVHIYPSDLERMSNGETFCIVFSLPCCRPGENTVPLVPFKEATQFVEVPQKEFDHLRSVEFAFNEWLDKSEWVQKDTDGLFRGMLGTHRADCMHKAIDQLRTANAEQAEKLAAIGETIYQARNKNEKQWGEVSKAKFDFYAGSPEIGVEVRTLCLLQSIPPEPQAGVELAEEEIMKLAKGSFSWQQSQYPSDLIAFARAIERALNQRQAVKPLSAAQGVPEGKSPEQAEPGQA